MRSRKTNGASTIRYPVVDQIFIKRGLSEQRLPMLWSDFDVGTILDLPCGDFYWMKHVPMDYIRYIGADILSELIQRNNELYGHPNVAFRRMNLLEDRLPKVDLILCRDCLVHFSYRHVETALRNICDSGSTYLLTTTFTERRRNHDIATGEFCLLNLEAQPFSARAYSCDQRRLYRGGWYLPR